jgi:hypothetical protein
MTMKLRRAGCRWRKWRSGRLAEEFKVIALMVEQLLAGGCFDID